ncbi:MAG TPA: hypothetical protein VKU60_12720, partial [Chloroflexota bacterium]|nr:hypothetical protein [Chloroflexota bacterium]
MAAACPLRAAEVFVLGGLTQDTASDSRSYAWQLEYLQDVYDENLAAGLSYLNDGHLPSHHRDGYAAQLWAHTCVLDQRLSLAGGIGPYYYSDTTNGALSGTLRNDHGVAAMLSMAATWHTDSPWLLRLQTNLVEGSSIDTLSVVAGIGYQLDPSLNPAASTPARPDTPNEVAFMAGESILNTANSEGSVAASVEYRRRVWSYVDGSIAWLYEGPSRENGQ